MLLVSWILIFINILIAYVPHFEDYLCRYSLAFYATRMINITAYVLGNEPTPEHTFVIISLLCSIFLKKDYDPLLKVHVKYVYHATILETYLIIVSLL